MIYSDGVHLISDQGNDDLHAFAKRIGIHPCWFHRGRFDHYDIPKKRRADFFKYNPDVKQVDAREIVTILKKAMEQNGR